MEVHVIGKVNLYGKPMISSGGGFVGSSQEFYIAKENENELIWINTYGIAGTFKKTLSDYLKECEPLVKRIDSGEFKKSFEDLYKIICYYNFDCN